MRTSALFLTTLFAAVVISEKEPEFVTCTWDSAKAVETCTPWPQTQTRAEKSVTEKRGEPITNLILCTHVFYDACEILKGVEAGVCFDLKEKLPEKDNMVSSIIGPDRNVGCTFYELEGCQEDGRKFHTTPRQLAFQNLLLLDMNDKISSLKCDALPPHQKDASQPVAKIERRGYRKHDVNRLNGAAVGTANLCTARDLKECHEVNAKDQCVNFTDDYAVLAKDVSSIAIAEYTECRFYFELGCDDKKEPPGRKFGTWLKIEWSNLQWTRDWPNWNDKLMSVMCWQDK